MNEIVRTVSRFAVVSFIVRWYEKLVVKYATLLDRALVNRTLLRRILLEFLVDCIKAAREQSKIKESVLHSTGANFRDPFD